MSFSFEFEADTNVQSTEPVVKDSFGIKEAEVTLPANSTERKILDKEKELEDITISIQPKVDEKKRLENEVKEIREKMQALINEKQEAIREIDLELWDARAAQKRLRTEIETLRRVLQQELENARKTEEYKSNILEFSKRISNFQYIDRILPHQKEGAFVLATSGRAILGDKRGLGKTLTSIATLDALQAQKVLVIVPDDILSNFVNEIHYWAPHRTVFPVGKMPKAQRQFAFTMAKQLDQWIMVVNYSAWRKDKAMLDTIISLGIECVIADEAHTMKNTSTSAYKGVERIVMAENVCPICNSLDIKYSIRHSEQFYTTYYDKCNTCGWDSKPGEGKTWGPLDRKSVKYVFPMTGTVILNKPQDLFANLHLVDPVLFDQESTFLRMYCTQDIYTGKWKFQYGGLERLTKKLGGKYLARDEKSAGVVRPPQHIEIHEVELDRENYPLQAKVIDQLSKHAQIMLDSGHKMNVLFTIALITRKRQANIWPAGIQLKNEKGDVVFNVGDEVQESQKLDMCLRLGKDENDGLIPEFTEDGDKENGSRVVVFSQFKGPLKELERRCNEAGISVVRFDGDTPEDIRNQAKLDFDRKYCEDASYNDGQGYKWQVMLCNYRTGGQGLNFNAATETIILDEEWNPGKADQAFGRTDRMGQTQETNVHILRIAGSIDSWMVALNAEKKDIIDGFETSAKDVASDLLTAMKNGDIL